MTDYSGAWLDAIHEATACLNASSPLPQDARDGGNNRAVESSLKYLGKLETVLRAHEQDWDQLPSFVPPKFKGKRRVKKENDENKRTQESPRVVNDNNPFATFLDDSDEDSAEEIDEAGDYPVLNLPSLPSLVMRRLMIRLLTAQSDLYRKKAGAFRYSRPPQWVLGAETYQASLVKIHDAIQLADSEISRLFALEQKAKELVHDANIVEVAIQDLTQAQDRYKHAAQQQQESLLYKLQPQWSSRNEARTRIGQERWNNNPNPKNDHYRRREQDEKQLRDVQAALEQLHQLDTVMLEQDSQQLKARLQCHDQPQQRYNGSRPRDISKRVSLQNYPDPTLFGWTFTGSWRDVVEFFEKEEIKLDWYFTTGTVKTAMDHPTRGKTQLFGSRVTPEVYMQILQDPRAHTNVRYHTRAALQQK